MRFCPQCGEERLRPDDLSLRDLLAQLLKNATSVDGKLLRSWRTLLTSPGSLTAAHVRGERRRTMNPLTLFFIANAVFVAMQSLTGVDVLSSPLSSHLHTQDWSGFARSLVHQRLVERQITLEAYAPVFDRVALFNAKTLIILMALTFAPLTAIIFRRRHLPAGAHIVFALHLYAFVLLVLSVSVLLAEIDFLLVGRGLGSATVDNVLSVLNLLACGGYIFLALPKIYSAAGWRRWASTLVMTAVLALLFVGYRFVIFLLTFYAT